MIEILWSAASDEDISAEADRRNILGLPVYRLVLMTVRPEDNWLAEVDFRTDPPTVHRSNPGGIFDSSPNIRQPEK